MEKTMEQTNLPPHNGDQIEQIEAELFQQFKDAFNEMQNLIHCNAVDHGFWMGERNDGEAIALMHSELSEALEGIRSGALVDTHCPFYSPAEIELADCIIRIMDYAEGKGLNLSGALIAKYLFNRTRPYKHGKEF